MDLDTVLGSIEANETLAPCEIFVDEEGEWLHKGNRIIREDILELFYDNLSLTAEGTYIIEWKDGRCFLEVADTPFVVARVDRTQLPEGEAILLTLRHLGVSEKLLPETLGVGADNVLYCRVRDGRFPARFSRPAYYQIAEWIEQDPERGRFYIELKPNKSFIASA